MAEETAVIMVTLLTVMPVVTVVKVVTEVTIKKIYTKFTNKTVNNFCYVFSLKTKYHLLQNIKYILSKSK